VLVRRGWILLTLLALIGCSKAQPQREHAVGPPLSIPKPSPTGRPHPARPGTVCGQVTTVSGGQARVVVVKGRVTCAEALRVLDKYNDPTTPAEGAAQLAVVDHWTCQTQRALTTCTLKAATIQARH
jgi:hypothetical protein